MSSAFTEESFPIRQNKMTIKGVFACHCILINELFQNRSTLPIHKNVCYLEGGVGEDILLIIVRECSLFMGW
jgi:hypothetical protein